MAIVSEAAPGFRRKGQAGPILLGLFVRLLELLLVLLGISTLLFFLIRLTGDPAAVAAGDNASAATVAQVRRALKLDQPLLTQYLDFIGGAVRFDFGNSFRSQIPAMELVVEKIPPTLILALTSLATSLLIAFPLGTLAAVNRGKLLDRFISFYCGLAVAVPGFFLGLLLIIIFAVNLHWLPAVGDEGPRHLILPAAVLSVAFSAFFIRLIRSSLLDVLGQDYIRTARSKGLANRAVLMRHALRNSLLPVVTAIGLNMSQVLGGSVIVENVFSRPGMGTLLIESVQARDYPVAQATVFVIALFVFAVSFLIDFVYQFIDPRLRK